jgi:hypothetical protein
MKQIIFKSLILLPALLFADWIIMIIVGCISNICSANTVFFNTIYLYFGLTLIILTFLLLAVIFSENSITKKWMPKQNR